MHMRGLANRDMVGEGQGSFPGAGAVHAESYGTSEMSHTKSGHEGEGKTEKGNGIRLSP